MEKEEVVSGSCILRLENPSTLLNVGPTGKRAVSASPKPNPVPEEVTDWLLSWLARCFQLNPVCRDKGRRTQSTHHTGNCGEL